MLLLLLLLLLKKEEGGWLREREKGKGKEEKERGINRRNKHGEQRCMGLGRHFWSFGSFAWRKNLSTRSQPLDSLDRLSSSNRSLPCLRVHRDLLSKNHSRCGSSSSLRCLCHPIGSRIGSGSVSMALLQEQ